MLVVRNTSAFGFGVISRLPFSVAIEHIKEAFEAEGFRFVSEIDMRDTLCKALGVSIAPYTVLGFCNPRVALRALMEETEFGLLLPWNVLVQAGAHCVHVSVMDPRPAIRLTENCRLRPLSDELYLSMERALEQFAKEFGAKEVAA